MIGIPFVPETILWEIDAQDLATIFEEISKGVVGRGKIKVSYPNPMLTPFISGPGLVVRLGRSGLYSPRFFAPLYIFHFYIKMIDLFTRFRFVDPIITFIPFIPFI